ncbi:MAG TPA: Com family DNA-binding transcriptional regulator [Patescibacteria group bacterium]|nr:Com family DNA-binding transcriptional regulator [Patescibacteria group bacterium]
MPEPLLAKILREYRCQNCHKLLCKGMLYGTDTTVEVKCRGCGQLCTFHGEDAEIISHRSVLIKKGLIPDTDPD